MAEFCVAAIQGAKLMDQLGSRSGGWKNVNGCTKAKNIAVQNFEENLISEDGKENLLKNCLFDDKPSVAQAVVFRVEEEPVDAHATEQDPMQKKKNKRKNVRFDDEPPDVCYIEYPEEGLCVCHDTDVEPYWPNIAQDIDRQGSATIVLTCCDHPVAYHLQRVTHDPAQRNAR